MSIGPRDYPSTPEHVGAVAEASDRSVLAMANPHSRHGREQADRARVELVTAHPAREVTSTWGPAIHRRKGTTNTLTALKSIRAARPDGAPIYVILDNLSAHKGPVIQRWAKRNKVNLCFTPTNASWANRSKPTSGRYGSSPWPTPSTRTTPRRHARCTPTCAGATPTPATPTSSPPNAANKPASAVRKASAGEAAPSTNQQRPDTRRT